MSVWAELVGQAEVVQRLQVAVAAGPTHAWLITGPPGSGRSTAAMAFAAALQCADQGCGQCRDCQLVLNRNHPDVRLIRTETMSLGVADVRELVRIAGLVPAGGGYQVIVIEDADRLTEAAANALLKAIEEPHERTLWVLCAPTADDVLPTIRSRSRLLVLATPSAAEVAQYLQERLQVPAEIAAEVAGASQGHIGWAKALATDEETRSRRHQVVSWAPRLRGLADAVTAASQLQELAAAEGEKLSDSHDEAELAELDRAYGVVNRGRRPQGYAAARRELERSQKSRARRRHLDVLDRYLMDLVTVYRDALTLQTAPGGDIKLVNQRLEAEVSQLAAASTAAQNIARIDAIFAARAQLLEFNVAPLLVLEALFGQLLPQPPPQRSRQTSSR